MAEDNVFTNKVFERMLDLGHQLDFVPILDLALSLGILSESNEDLDFIEKHEMHLYPPLAQLMEALICQDGQRYDVRVNFVNMEDSIRLRRDLTMSVKSLPALSWKERVYTYLVDLFIEVNPTFDDDVGINVGNLLAQENLRRPLSLKLCRRISPTKVIVITDADMLREILDQDKRFVMRFNLQDEIHRERAEAKATTFNQHREWVIRSRKSVADYPRTSFANEYAVSLVSDPVYILRYAAVSAPKADATKEEASGGVHGTEDTPGVCGCGAVLYKKNIHRLSGGRVECEEVELWRFRAFVGNRCLRQVGEYRALLKGLRECTSNGHFPLLMQSWSHQVNDHANALVHVKPDFSTLDYSALKRYVPIQPKFQSPQCIPLYAEAKALYDDLHAVAIEEHYRVPSYYNILALPDVKKTSHRVWKVTGSDSDFKLCGNGRARPPARVVGLSDVEEGEKEQGGALDISAWEGHVSGTLLALSMQEPPLPAMCFERSHVDQPRYQPALEEALLAREEGLMLDRGWQSKVYVPSDRSEGWLKNRKYES